MFLDRWLKPRPAKVAGGKLYASAVGQARSAIFYRDHGVQINNPHVYIVEDGKQNHLDPAVVGMKRRFDPQGLLNPGKLRSWYAATQLAPETKPARQTA